jgi:valyl-tRNA synthetase
MAMANVRFWWNNGSESEDFKYYYPTNDLVTVRDILFFWVARMIIAGYEYNKKTFTNVYLTGLVRDNKDVKCLNH